MPPDISKHPQVSKTMGLNVSFHHNHHSQGKYCEGPAHTHPVPKSFKCIQQICIEYLPHASHCSRNWGDIREQKEDRSWLVKAWTQKRQFSTSWLKMSFIYTYEVLKQKMLLEAVNMSSTDTRLFRKRARSTVIIYRTVTWKPPVFLQTLDHLQWVWNDLAPWYSDD